MLSVPAQFVNIPAGPAGLHSTAQLHCQSKPHCSPPPLPAQVTQIGSASGLLRSAAADLAHHHILHQLNGRLVSTCIGNNTNSSIACVQSWVAGLSLARCRVVASTCQSPPTCASFAPGRRNPLAAVPAEPLLLTHSHAHSPLNLSFSLSLTRPLTCEHLLLTLSLTRPLTCEQLELLHGLPNKHGHAVRHQAARSDSVPQQARLPRCVHGIKHHLELCATHRGTGRQAAWAVRVRAYAGTELLHRPIPVRLTVYPHLPHP